MQFCVSVLTIFGFNDFRFYAVFAYAGKIVYKVVYRLKDVFIRVFKANVGAIFSLNKNIKVPRLTNFYWISAKLRISFCTLS